MKSTTKEGAELDDEDMKNNIKNNMEEVKAEFEPLPTLMKEVFGDNVEKGRCEFPVGGLSMHARMLTTSEYCWPANVERIMNAQALRDNSILDTLCQTSHGVEPEAHHHVS